MKIITRCLFIGLIGLLWSCQPDRLAGDEARNHLPADAALVLAYQPRALMEKGGYDETMQWPSVQKMLDQAQEENPYFAKILKNPAESGVNLDARFYFAAHLDVLEQDPKGPFAYWLFSIADPDKFEKLWNEMDAPVQPIANDHRYLSENGQTFISWTDTWGVVGTGQKDELKTKLQEIMDLPAGQSLAANKNFRKCLAESADAALWMGSNGLASTIAAQGLGILANYSEEDLRDNYLHHFLYFDDGLIRTQSKFYLKRKITTDLDLLFRDRVKTDFTKNLPAGQIEAIFTAALNPKGINQVLIEKYAKLAVREAFKQRGLSFDDLIGALDGDIALAAYEQDSTETGLFVARIGDRGKLDALLRTAAAKGIVAPQGDQFYQVRFEETAKDTAAVNKPFKLEGLLLIKDDFLYMGSSEELLAKVQRQELIAGQDWQRRLQEMSKDQIFSLLVPVFQTPLRENMEVEKVEAIANRRGAELQIHLTDKDRNSLYQLMQGIRKEMEEKNERGEKKI